MKSQVSAFVKASEAGPVVVTKNGRPVAVLIGVQDEEEIEQLLLGYSRRLRAILDRSRKQIDEGEGIGHDQFWSEVDRPKRCKGASKPAGG